MSARRAKQHKIDIFLDVRARKFWKTFDQEGLMHKDLRKFADRPHKFRKRAYHREKEIEKKKVQQTLEETLDFFRTLLKILG